MPAKQTSAAQTVDDYLARLGADKRSALEKLRKTILAAAPQADECIAYNIPAVRLGGKILVAYGAAADHCALYPGAHPLEVHQEDLRAYKTGKGTIRFAADRPLPAALVRKLVKTRIAQYAKDANSS